MGGEGSLGPWQSALGAERLWVGSALRGIIILLSTRSMRQATACGMSELEGASADQLPSLPGVRGGTDTQDVTANLLHRPPPRLPPLPRSPRLQAACGPSCILEAARASGVPAHREPRPGHAPREQGQRLGRRRVPARCCREGRVRRTQSRPPGRSRERRESRLELEGGVLCGLST